MKMKSVVDNVYLLWKNESQWFLSFHTAIDHNVYCNGSGEIEREGLILFFLTIQNCVNHFLLDSVVPQPKCWKFLLSCLIMMALDLIEYYSFVEATASCSTCVLHLDDLKA